jgi:hypothetical protein
MPVFRFISARRNAMPIDIEDAAFDAQIDSRRFPPAPRASHPRQIGVAVGMAAGLQPAVQLAVMHQQHPHTIRTDQPRRASEVALHMAALEYRRVGLKEIAELSG